jgi:hypothetical protein
MSDALWNCMAELGDSAYPILNHTPGYDSKLWVAGGGQRVFSPALSPSLTAFFLVL